VRGSEKLLFRVFCLATVLGWASYLALLAHLRYGGDFRAFLCLGHKVPHPAVLASVPAAGPYGYDGQYYAALATDPLLLRGETSRYLDAPSYRASRIFLPLAAWLLAGGWEPVAVVLYQLLGWGLGLLAVFLVARWQQEEGAPFWLAWSLPSSVGLVVSFLRCTPDGAALAFLLWALWAHRRARLAATTGALVAAVLTRETSILLAAALAFWELRQKRWTRAFVFLAAPLAVMVGWQVSLHLRLGRAFATGAGNFAWPFTWLPEKLASLATLSRLFLTMEVLGLLALALCLAAGLFLVLKGTSLGPVELAFLAFVALGLFLSYKVYVEVFAYSRVLIALPFFASLLGEKQQSPGFRWLFRSIALGFALMGLALALLEWREGLQGRSLWQALGEGTIAIPPPAGEGN